MSKPTPGNGFLGWLGRQVGYVAKAAVADVTPKSPAVAPPRAAAAPAARQAPPAPLVVYRADDVAEVPHPTDPNLKLRRTTINEVIANPPKDEGKR